MDLDKYTELANKILDNTDPEKKHKGLSNLIDSVAAELPDAITVEHRDLVLSNRKLRFDFFRTYILHQRDIGNNFRLCVNLLNKHRDEVEQWECEDEATIADRKEKLKRYAQYSSIKLPPKVSGYRKDGTAIIEYPIDPNSIYCESGTYRKYDEVKDVYYYQLGRMIQTSNAANGDLKKMMQAVCLMVALNNERSIVEDELRLLGIEIPKIANKQTEWNDISTLRTKADHYLNLMKNIGVCYIPPQRADIKQTVNELHEAIHNVNIDEIPIALSRQNTNQTWIVREMEFVVSVIEQLIELIGNKLPDVITIDPNAAEVFKFSKEAIKVLSGEYENLKSRRNTDPTAADDEAVDKLRLYELGFYGDLTFDDFIKEYIIKGLSHIEIVRRLNYMISKCGDEHTKKELSKFLYWGKCDENAIKELHDAFVDFYRFYDYAANVSPIPSEGNRNEVTTRLFSVLEWCKQHDNEFEKQLINRPLLKDVENLSALATHICESFENWCLVIGYDDLTLELFNDVGDILDNVIVPTIEQRNPTSTKPEPTPEPQPTPSVEAIQIYTPIKPFDMSALYRFLIDEGILTEEFDKKQFDDCISQGNIKALWEISPTRNYLKLSLQILKEYYQDEIQQRKRKNPSWYLKCCESVDKSAQEMGKTNIKKHKREDFCRKMKKNISLP